MYSELLTRGGQTCVEVTENATYNCRWKAGLNLNVDEVILKGDVIAYLSRTMLY